MTRATTLSLCILLLGFAARAEADPLIELVDFMLPTQEKKDEFAIEDARRVELLTGYVAGETSYADICSDWEVATNAHLNILGVAKNGESLTVIMGRDLESILYRKKYGTVSGQPAARKVFFGDCADKINVTHRISYQVDPHIVQCELEFTSGVLTENRCLDVREVLVAVGEVEELHELNRRLTESQ